MPGLAVGDIITVTYNFDFLGQKMMNVLHYRNSATSTGENWPVLADAIGHAMVSGTLSPGLSLLACMGFNANLTTVRVQKVSPSRFRYVDRVEGLPGTYDGASSVPNIAACITKYSDSASRHGRGALHVAAIPDGVVDEGLFTGGYLTLLGTLASKLSNTVTVSGETVSLQPVIWEPVDGGVYYPLTQAVVRPEVRTMHRRTLGLGI